MEKQDIEKLKAFCKEEGIEMIPTKDTGVYAFKSKWMGVEFVRCISAQPPFFTKDKIYPVAKVEGNNIWVRHCDDRDANSMYIGSGEPSSETEYVMQLKAKADELGLTEAKPHEIEPATHTGNFPKTEDIKHWTYLPANDRLFTASVGGICVYDRGTWATKIDSKIRVNIAAYDFGNSNDMRFRFSTNKQRSLGFDWDHNELANHIEECIEAYFNGKND